MLIKRETMRAGKLTCGRALKHDFNLRVPIIKSIDTEVSCGISGE